MKLLVLTYGTEGDTRPLTMLCRGLLDAGHRVQLLAEAGTLDSARDQGVPHAALEGHIQQDVVSLVSRGNRLTAAARGLARMARRHVPAWMRQADAAASGCDAVLSGGLAAFVGLAVAERHGLPAVGAGMIPLSPTRRFASPFLPPLPLPGALKRLSYPLVNRVVWAQFRGSVDPVRRSWGLPPQTARWPGMPMLYGLSPCLLPRPPDWPANHVVCGQWRAPDSSGWRPSPALQAFLQAGEPPVYIGFGSMTGFDRNAVLGALLQALAGRRVLLFPGWSGRPSLPLPGNVHVIGPTPHEALFPLTAAVVHHGGSGTTHSACRAGVPSLVMPFAADQFFWARRLQALGVAPAPLSSRRLDPRRLAAALAFASHPATRARAAALAGAMAGEDGVGNGVAALERWLVAG